MKDKGGKVNYRTRFILGIIFVGTGITLATTVGPVGFGMLALGGLLMISAARHADEWRSDIRKK